LYPCPLALCLQERKLAILVYGFPPGVGATGTAALLNVPKSLENLLASLREVSATGLVVR
jgi:cobalamin biosynthesis Mg chelatase CobN